MFPHELKALLQNRTIIKTGVNIKGKIPLSAIAFPAEGFFKANMYTLVGDALKLYRDFRILTNGLVELGTLARATHAEELQEYKGLSLRLLCAIFVSIYGDETTLNGFLSRESHS